MNKEFIPYEQALELKKLGFDELCFAYYDNIGKLFFNTNGQPVGKDWVWEGNQIVPTDMALAPLYQQAFRWFRKKGLYHDIKMFGDWDKPQFSYIVSGRTMNNPAHMYYYEDKDSYEEAELECLKKLIEIAKNNQK